MVKNFGGNKSKKQGRKFVNAPQDRKLRFAEEIEELYSVVIKMFGNGMCEVKCIDGKNRLCIFRKKFKGRSKRDNMVSIGSVILVGIRTWEVIAPNSEKLEKCDLLEVYSTADVQKLYRMASWEDWHVLSDACDLFGPTFEKEDEGGIQFVNEEITEFKDLSDSKETAKITMDQSSLSPTKDTSTEDSVFETNGVNLKINTSSTTVKSSKQKNKKKISDDDDDFDIDDI